jgi:hypothetical protein
MFLELHARGLVACPMMVEVAAALEQAAAFKERAAG